MAAGDDGRTFLKEGSLLAKCFVFIRVAELGVSRFWGLN